jgi:nucleotide-binding universal stress UspA family protein
MFQRILVPIDFSPAAAAAWDLACELAGSKATLVALNVVPPLYPDVAYANLPAAMREQQRENEHRLTAFAVPPAGPELAIERRVVIGNPADVIIAEARDSNADLIVLGVHRRHGLDRWLRGSVTEHVVPAAPCHVLVAKTER